MLRVRQQIACPKMDEITGNPVCIAFLDTGITAMHPDFSQDEIIFRDFVNGIDMAYDDAGHGTHVCGIAAGSGLLSGGRYRGIAPGSRILMAKVLDRNGDGTAENMLRGMEWIFRNKARYQIRIMNISIGIGILQDEEKERELRQYVDEAWNQGLVVVCAAGNTGPERATISALGKSRNVITVGCHDGEYYKDSGKRCEMYSGRGPADRIIKKPDLVAPGTEIISCNAAYRTGNRRRNAPAYVKKSGTSMATPMVSGAAALLLQKWPEMKQEMIKKRLLYAATDLKEPWTKQGFGMLNIKRALQQPEIIR